MEYRTYYQILGIDQSSTLAAIREAFHSLALLYHPDKNDNSIESNKVFRIILSAYQVLSNSALRKEYDSFLQNRHILYGSKDHKKVHRQLEENFADINLLDNINFTLWEIDDILSSTIDLNCMINSHTFTHYLLIVLTFLDRWILEEYGFSDYFMQARGLNKVDPRIYINLLDNVTIKNYHIAYTDFKNYFFDIRRRANRFITKYEKQLSKEIDTDNNQSMMDRINEYHNMAIHYLSHILKAVNDDTIIIPAFKHSNSVYEYNC